MLREAGLSEHQTGLAIDVGKADKDVDFIAPSFQGSGIYLKFKQLAASFGFILSGVDRNGCRSCKIIRHKIQISTIDIIAGDVR
ncbi:D-alanyl-D-alanine carboxypeptidase family protein [Paenibacillus sp. LHD-38]|uniref:D-alanyl-D-alanine carboxypeptidase family protein n=1 Tax=Paenibacillus sp. LHD-38 TaxID=3072143 RepID=UPI00280E4EE9|nr:D-alanyl-D-alanine carboxypeptidase family protein [Paenibacillus sp. LHD-38]MDQ8733652.1 D-alanyl-D-alanine carboxypeptidase family protein [Paenibacillus sp. LHD-38]